MIALLRKRIKPYPVWCY